VTAVGEVEEVVVPFPNWYCELSPQHLAAPEITAQVVLFRPEVTLVTPVLNTS
jgi:hypothetical protein